jgi:hypothetical protein
MGRVCDALVETAEDETRTDPMSQTGPVGGGGRSGAAVAWIGWWVVSAAVYLVLVDSVSPAELVTGSVIAIIGASGATLVRAQRRAVMRPEPAWLLRLWRPVVRYPVDLLTLTRALVKRRPVQGRLFALTFDPGPDDARSAARRVLGPTAGSFAPNTFVVGFDPVRGLLLVHQLLPSGDPIADADPLRLR